MKKLLIGAWLLVSTAVLAQVPPKGAKTSSPKSTPGSTKPASGSIARSTRPLPQPSLKEKLKSGNSNNPNYTKAEDHGKHVKRDYSPRRTASGARKDTLNKRKH
ncbi:hypothetical protein [Spirosoma areae]